MWSLRTFLDIQKLIHKTFQKCSSSLFKTNTDRRSWRNKKGILRCWTGFKLRSGWDERSRIQEEKWSNSCEFPLPLGNSTAATLTPHSKNHRHKNSDEGSCLTETGKTCLLEQLKWQPRTRSGPSYFLRHMAPISINTRVVKDRTPMRT